MENSSAFLLASIKQSIEELQRKVDLLEKALQGEEISVNGVFPSPDADIEAIDIDIIDDEFSVSAEEEAPVEEASVEEEPAPVEEAPAQEVAAEPDEAAPAEEDMAVGEEFPVEGNEVQAVVEDLPEMEKEAPAVVEEIPADSGFPVGDESPADLPEETVSLPETDPGIPEEAAGQVEAAAEPQPAPEEDDEPALLLELPKAVVTKVPRDTHRRTRVLMDVMEEKKAWRQDIPGSQVSNILSAISLNDRILFINALFGGDAVRFQEAIARLNACSDLDEAENYVIDSFKNWKMDTDTVYRFMMAVRRKLG